MINIKNMMKKFLSLLMIFGVAFSMVSCKSELKDVKYTPENNNISFASSTASFALEGQDVVVKIQRGIANEQVTLNITMEDTKGVYTLSTPSVIFEPGSYIKEIILKYDLGKIKPLEAYNFKLSFNAADKAITGYANFSGDAKMLLEFNDYGTIACAKGSFLGHIPAEKRSYNLQLAQYTTNYYRIVGFYGSETNLEFTLKDGLAYITEPKVSYYNAELVKDYPMHKFVTAAKHPQHGIMTAWVDSNPEYSNWTELGANEKVIVGSRLGLDAFYTVSAGFFGWNRDEFQVTAVK